MGQGVRDQLGASWSQCRQVGPAWAKLVVILLYFFLEGKAPLTNLDQVGPALFPAVFRVRLNKKSAHSSRPCSCFPPAPKFPSTNKQLKFSLAVLPFAVFLFCPSQFQARKKSTNPNFWVRIIFSAGVGVFHMKGWGHKVRYVPSKPGKSNFFGGISLGFCWDIPVVLVAQYRAIFRYSRCDTPYRAILFEGGEHSPKMVRYPPFGT